VTLRWGKGVKKTIPPALKVPRQCPLVLLVGVKHMIRNISKFNFYGIRGAELERSLIRH
jgi:hypothetical protein